MIKNIQKYTLVVLMMIIFLAFNSSGALAADDNVFDLGTKIINDINKTWTVTFNNNVDFTSVPGNIQVKDLISGNDISVTSTEGNSKAIVKVSPPSGGYTVGHNYQISVNKNVKLASGGYLGRTTVLNFVVQAKDTSYTISANVIVSPTINIFKQITITSTNIPGAVKYKLEGNDKIVDIGKTMTLIAADTVKVYIYDSAGNVLGTTNMDVSTTKSGIKLNLQ